MDIEVCFLDKNNFVDKNEERLYRFLKEEKIHFTPSKKKGFAIIRESDYGLSCLVCGVKILLRNNTEIAEGIK